MDTCSQMCTLKEKSASNQSFQSLISVTKPLNIKVVHGGTHRYATLRRYSSRRTSHFKETFIKPLLKQYSLGLKKGFKSNFEIILDETLILENWKKKTLKIFILRV